MEKHKKLTVISVIHALTYILLFSLLLGQLGGIPVYPGVMLYVHDLVVGLILGIGIPYSIRVKKPEHPSRYIPIVGFVLVCIMSLAVNYFRFDANALLVSALYPIRWTAYACVYVVLSNVLPAAGIGWGLYATGTAVSVLGLFQYVLYPELRNLSYLGWDPHFYRLFSTFFDPNFVGLFIVLTLLLGVQLSKTKHAVWLWTAQGINLLALYLTYSRSSYLGFIVAVAVIIIGRRKYFMFALLSLFVLLLVVIPKPGGNTLLLTRMDSTQARIGNWLESVALIRQSPVIGNGFNTIRYVRNNHLSSSDQPISKSGAGLDSSILFILATTGAVGLLVYVWMVFSLIRPYFVSKKLASARVFIVSVITAMLVHSLFVNSLFYPWVMLWFWIVLAVSEEFSMKVSGQRL